MKRIVIRNIVEKLRCDLCIRKSSNICEGFFFIHPWHEIDRRTTADERNTCIRCGHKLRCHYSLIPLDNSGDEE